MPASQQRTPRRNARLATAAVAVALLIALGAIGKRLFLDQVAPREVIERSDDGACEVEAATTDERPLPVAARTQDDTASGKVVATIEAAARPTGEVRGTVRRQRDGSAVTEGVVVLSFVVLGDHVIEGRPLDASRFAKLDYEERLACHDFDEAPIAADGTFRCRLPAPAIVRRATIRPRLGSNSRPQFLESEHELADLPLAIDGALELPLAVDDGGSIEGIVVTKEGGFPLRGARVSLPWWSDDNGDWACESDVDGGFRIAGIRRVVAEARSNSEAFVSCVGYVPRRFLVPPADDGLDVKGLRLEMERGVAVAVVAVAPEGLDAVARAEWDEAIGRASALLLPMPPHEADPIVAPGWFREARTATRHEEGWRFDFAPIAPTHDAIAVIRLVSTELRAGEAPLAKIAIDASIERAPWRVVVPVPTESMKGPLQEPRFYAVMIELRTPDGNAVADAMLAFRLRPYAVEWDQSRTNRDGQIDMYRPRPNGYVELRVAGYDSAWLVVNPAAPPAVTTPDPQAPLPLVVVTLRPLPPAR